MFGFAAFGQVAFGQGLVVGGDATVLELLATVGTDLELLASHQDVSDLVATVGTDAELTATYQELSEWWASFSDNEFFGTSDDDE